MAAKKITHCLSSGTILSNDKNLKNDQYLERDVIIGYDGTFEAMEGEVTVTPKHLSSIVRNHNGKLAKLKRMALGSGEIEMKDCPPLQADHSRSALHTLGRVVGNIRMMDGEVDGKKKILLIGRARFMGKENMEKVEDGRFCHFSMGANLEDPNNSVLAELSVVPFPAAEGASYLSSPDKGASLTHFSVSVTESLTINRDKVESIRVLDSGHSFMVEVTFAGGIKNLLDVFEYSDLDSKKQASEKAEASFKSNAEHPEGITRLSQGDQQEGTCEMVQFEDYKSRRIEIYRTVYGLGTYLTTIVDGTLVKKAAEDLESSLQNGRDWIDSKKTSTLSNGADTSKVEKIIDQNLLPTQGDEMNKEKLKKHLMESKKLSAEAADKHLATLSEDEQKKLSAECDEKEKKMSAESDEKDKKDAEEKKAKDAKMAAKTSFTSLAKGFRTTSKQTALAARKGQITARLSALRSQAVMTPAEQKMIKIDELAGKSDGEIESYFSAFACRQPVIPVGSYGSPGAANLSKLSSLSSSQKEDQLMAESAANMSFTGKGVLAKLGLGKAKPMGVINTLSTPKEETTANDNLASEIAALDEVEKHLSAGKIDDAKLALKACRSMLSNGGFHSIAQVEQMTALAENTKKLHNQFEELVTLVSPILGVEASELE